MIAIVDYGVGNLFSLVSCLSQNGLDAVVTADAAQLEAADRIILPGVGAFEDARKKLAQTGLDDVLKRLAAEGKPILGICLGMQMLFDKSYEGGEYEGLGLIPGEVVYMGDNLPENVKVPHMGWNSLQFKVKGEPILEGIGTMEHVYFVHSFYVRSPLEYMVATSDYGVEVPAIVKNGNVYGMQFHPEKSGQTGSDLLKNFNKI